MFVISPAHGKDTATGLVQVGGSLPDLDHDDYSRREVIAGRNGIDVVESLIFFVILDGGGISLYIS